MQPLRDLIAERESRLVARVLADARERGYTKYTSTLEEAAEGGSRSSPRSTGR